MKKPPAKKGVTGSGWPGDDDCKAAKEILGKIFSELKTTISPLEKDQEDNKKFFPNGIELIYFKFKVPPVELELKVAGAAGVKGSLSGNQALSWEQKSSEQNSMEGV